MRHSSSLFDQRRANNQAALSAFSLSSDDRSTEELVTIHAGSINATVYTIGYEKRDGEELVSRLIDHGIDVLVDVRERPFSRKPDFRRQALEAACNEAGIRYESWTRLGSTAAQREIHASGEINIFMNKFRAFAKRGRAGDLDDLAKLAKKKTIALICYERCHKDCHRSVLAELLLERLDATIVAIQ